VHNDANLDNVLVDPVTGAVTAILDFGDVVRTPRAIDLAVLASYLLPDDGDPASVVAEVVSGWESVLPLTADERGMLPILIAGRLAQRILIASWLSRATPENAGYARRTLALTRAQLVRFTEEF